MDPAPKAETGERLVHRRRHRILSGKDFDRVFKLGRRGRGSGLSLVVCDAQGDTSRLGLAVARKVGNAPRRNRVRRLLREAFRLEHRSWPAPLDVVVIPSGPGFPDTLDDVRRLLSRTVKRALESPSGQRRRRRRPPKRDKSPSS